MKRKHIIKIAVSALLIILWGILMHRLSAADGATTLNDSMWFTKRIANWLWDNPTGTQLNHLNLAIRKLAHIGLFFIFGWMLSIFLHILFEWKKVWLQMIGTLFCSGVVAFYDELQKIPISGRHFSASESMLNLCSAWCAAILCFVIFHLWKKHKGSLKNGT